MSMPVDAPYIIGVIRSKEQGLLQSDEYTRLIDAPNNSDAIRVLVDTPYGAWLESNTADDAFAALTKRLHSLQEWLEETLVDIDVLRFVQLRYDALNVATALIEFQAGYPEPTQISELGSIKPRLLQGVIFNQLGIDELTPDWKAFIKAEQDQLPSNNSDVATWKNGLLERCEDFVTTQMEKLASTPFMKWYVEFSQRRLASDRERRGETLTADFVSERDWDNELVEKIMGYAGDPIGYDPIIAYWLTVELEARTIRLVLAAKLQGSKPEDIRPLLRNLVGER